MGSTTIRTVRARQLIDCKCRPMVEADVITEGGAMGRASAPTGSSVGIHEAYVLRDGDKNEYGGLGVRRAVANVNEIIAPALVGIDALDQAAVDARMRELDGTFDLSHLGGNAVYSVSTAVLRAAAASQSMELYEYLAGGDIKTVPIPSFNVINGGRYENVIQPFNEFIVMPYRAGSIDRAVEIGVRVFQTLGRVLEKHLGRKPGVGGSYGYVAPSEDPEEVLGIIWEAVKEGGFEKEVALALDCASSEFYDRETKTYLLKGKRITAEELVDYAEKLTRSFDLVFIEDLLDEDDWDGFRIAHEKLKRTLIIGDDFCVSNPERIRKAHEMNLIDGFILKPNQVGTITQALEAHRYGVEHGLLSITSGRSGGVINDVVMDLAVGLQIGFIKNGCPRSGERIDKLNFLMRVKDLHEGCRLADISHIVRF